MFSASKTAGPSGYAIQRSVRLRSSASAYFNRTFTTPTNQAKWTWSGWVKRGSLGSLQRLLSSGTSASDTTTTTVYFSASDTLAFSGGTTNFRISNQVFRDPSAWYHIVIAVDTTLTEASKILIYVNGVQITFATTNAITTCAFNSAQTAYIGQFSSSQYFDGYLTEVNFVDGQALTPTSFAAYNSTTGVWQPIRYSGTYGTNGFFVNFRDNTSTTTLGYDYSGNSNNWTANNVSLTAGSTYDSMTDVPTLTSATQANYATLNPLRITSSGGFSNGNLTGTAETGTPSRGLTSTIVLPYTGKWYAEVVFASQINNWCGVTAVDFLAADLNTAGQMSVLYYALNGNKYVNGTATGYGASYTTETIGIAFDGAAGTVTFYKANVSQGAITLPSSTVNYVFCQGNAAGSAIAANWNFGQRPFAYTPPTGFVALNTYNLPTPTIKNGAAQFAASTYTGNGTSQSIVNSGNNSAGVSFKPDFVWLKQRSPTATGHLLEDAVRGALQYLGSEASTAESTVAGTVTAFNSNGFSIGSQAGTNTNTSTYIAWQWKASNTTAVSNTSGTITSSVSANPTAGFSIVTYTANNTAGATVGHGLGVAPKFIITKNRTNNSTNWATYHDALGATKVVLLNSTANVVTTSTSWNNTAPTSSVFTVSLNPGGGGYDTNYSTANYVAYCFAEIAGFSKFGSYTGNGAANGPFVYLGFRPRYVCVKRSDGSGGWTILDSSRDTYNVAGNYLFAETSAAEGSTPLEDFLSNGFKLRATSSSVNSAGTYIYFAFAENPFNYSLAR